MKRYLSLFSILLCLLSNLLWVSCESEENTPVVVDQTLEAQILTDQSYGPHPQQNYDLHLPADRSSASTKTMVVVHGGGWTSGDKQDLTAFINLLKTQFPNHAVVNMNYRLANLSGTPAFPNQLNDIKSLLDKLIQEQDNYQIHTDVALIGFSAGAHLSALYAYEYDDSNQVQAVVNIVGPTDFSDPYYANNAGFQTLFQALVDTSAFPPGTDPVVATSPALQVNALAPPTLNFYGDQDPLVALSQLQRLEAALSAHTVPYESTIYNGGHANWNVSQYLDLQMKLQSFLDIHY